MNGKKLFNSCFYRIKGLIKGCIKLFGSKQVRKQGNYIPCEQIVQAAKANGCSVGDYVEKIWDQVGGSLLVIEQLDAFGVFKNCRKMVEIGGGTGRYIEKVIKRYPVENIFSYETAEDWSFFLEKAYSPVLVKRNADGKSLGFEENNSVDAVLAHGVFVYLPFLQCFGYFKEMVRVAKPEGYIAFDVYLKEAFGLREIHKWLGTPERYPVVLDQYLIEQFFVESGCTFVGQFNNKYGHSFSTYLVFRKKAG